MRLYLLAYQSSATFLDSLISLCFVSELGFLLVDLWSVLLLGFCCESLAGAFSVDDFI